MSRKLYNTGNKIPYIYGYVTGDVKKFSNMIKIGMTRVKASANGVVTEEMALKSAEKRMKQQIGTAGIKGRVIFTTPALREVDDRYESFTDHDFHKYLEKNEVKRYKEKGVSAREWFEITLEELEQAMDSFKENASYYVFDVEDIELYPHQLQAVEEIVGAFENGNITLIAGKPRFGKVYTSYEIALRINAKKILIVTHRPNTNKGWSKDFYKMGMEELGYRYYSPQNGDIEFKDGEKIVQFISMQNLRGSGVGEEEELHKNEELFGADWDLLIIDEVHEGIKTNIAGATLEKIKAKKKLHLSGTSYNVLRTGDDSAERGFKYPQMFDYDHVFYWTYVDEREAKAKWDKEKPHLPNPYDQFPEMVLLSFSVQDIIDANYEELEELTNEGRSPTILMSKLFEVTAFNRFRHEKLVVDFLRKMAGDRKYSTNPELFPFHPLYEDNFRHTLWMLPGVPAVNAMEELLKRPDVGFAGWTVVNATGEGDEAAGAKALARVEEAVKGERSITLSQQMLTTGITVPEWTAVFQLNDSNSAIKWMQSGMRASTPGLVLNKFSKERFYIFDFNPNRLLKVVDEVAKSSVRGTEKMTPQELEEAEEKELKRHLKYIPILSFVEGKLKELPTLEVMKQINEALADGGFEDFASFSMYIIDTLLADQIGVGFINMIRSVQGLEGVVGEIEVTYSPEEVEKTRKALKELEDKAKKAGQGGEKLSKKERKRLKKLKSEQSKQEREKARNRRNAKAILIGIGTRIPLIVFAEPLDKEITVNNFNELMDDESWREFMPENLLRLMPEGTPSFEERKEEALTVEGIMVYWPDFSRYFRPHVFKATVERIRETALLADKFGPLERAVIIRQLIDRMSNPDKETVLTPSRVVDLQGSNSFGGLVFTDLEKSTARDTYILAREVESGARVSVPLRRFSDKLVTGSHSLAPVWVSKTGEVSEVVGDDGEINPDLVEVVEDGFWEEDDFSSLDPNSKTALYPQYMAVTRFFVKALKNGLDPFSNSTEARELWEDVVVNEIFLNVRVPYSARIAQRVLLPSDSEQRVNSTVFDLVKFRDTWGWWQDRCGKSFWKARAPEWWGERESFEEDAAKLFQLLSEKFLRKSGWGGAAAMVSGRVSELLEEIGKMELGGQMSSEELEEVGQVFEELFGFLDASFEDYDAVFGNPPYQKADGGDSTGSSPIYQDFMGVAKNLGKRVSLIYPSRWMLGGKGLDRFRKEEGQSPHYQKFFDYSNSKEIFPPPVNIAGGVNFFLWDKSKTDPEVEYYYDGRKEKRKEIIGKYSVRNPLYFKIVDKISPSTTFDTIVSPRDYYGKSVTNFKKVSSLEKEDTGVICHTVIRNQGIESIEIDYKGKDINDWKVGVSRTANGISEGLPRVDRAMIAGPNSLLSGSLIKIGSFKTREEAVNCLRYLKTDLAGFLLGVVTPTQDATRNNYRLIPLVDFATGKVLDKEVFLNFEKPETLDDQLAEIYGLTEDEREIIGKDLKPWVSKVDVEADV